MTIQIPTESSDIEFDIHIVMQKIDGVCNRLLLEHDTLSSDQIQTLQHILVLHKKQLQVFVTSNI